MQELLQEALSWGWLQWLAVIFNVLYVIFAAKQNRWCWVFGFIGVAILFIIYLEVRLYSDATLQVFYLVMAVYGWISWNDPKLSVKKVRRATVREHFKWISIGCMGALGLGYFWQHFGAALPYVDAFTTTFSIIATYMTAKKILENWWYWIVIDTICVGVYWIRDIPLIAILFFVYTLLAIYGYLTWKKQDKMALSYLD